MVSDDFKALTTDALRQLADLVGVEVVGGRDGIDAQFEVGIGGELIGDVQTEITDQRVLVAALQRFEQSTGADDDLTIQTEQEVDDALFLWLEDARTGDTRANASGFDLLNGGTQAIEFEVIQGDSGRFEFERGFKLFGSTDKQVQTWIASGGVCRRQTPTQITIHLQKCIFERGGWIIGNNRLRLGLLLNQVINSFLAQAVEQRTRDKGIAGYVGGEVVKLIGGIAQAAQLLVEILGGDAAAVGAGERLVGLDMRGDVGMFSKLPCQLKRLTVSGDDGHVNGLFVDRRAGVDEGLGSFIDIDIMITPDPIAGADAGEVDLTVAETQFKALASGFNLVDVAAFFFGFGAAPISGIKDDAIAGFEGCYVLNIGRLDNDVIFVDFRHTATEDTPMTRGSSRYDGLMVGAGDEVWAETA